MVNNYATLKDPQLYCFSVCKVCNFKDELITCMTINSVYHFMMGTGMQGSSVQLFSLDLVNCTAVSLITLVTDCEYIKFVGCMFSNLVISKESYSNVHVKYILKLNLHK